MKKILSIAGGVAVVALVAVVLVYAHIPVQHANAQPAPAATVPTITASTGPGDGNYYAQIGISSAGPFTEDFQYVFCFAASPNPPVGYADQNSGDVKCETSPWASDAANDGGVSNASNGNATLTGLWSPWFYSGVPESLYSGANLYIQQINTRPLPPGLFLTNVQVGVQAASDRVGGNQQATPSDVGTYTTVTDGSACVSSITPLPDGGQGPEAYGCLYGSGNSQKSAPDVLRIYIGAQLEGVSTAGDFPSTMTSGETNTTSTITVTNIGQTTVTSAGWIETDLGPGTGACTVDTNGDGIPDQVATGTALLAPDEAIAHADEIRCSIQVNVTSTDLLFTHNGNFTTPQTVPYAFDNITKLSTWRPGYSVENNCPPQDAGQPGTQPGTPGSCKPTIVPSLLSVAYGGAPSDIAPGQTATFSVNPFTAPVLKPGVASATSTETWTLSNSQGDVPGGVYTKMITVVAGVNPPGCNLKLSDCFNSNPVEVTSENSQTSTVGNVPVPAASWDILASPSLGNWTGIEDICTQEPGVIGKCSGSSAMYPDQPTDDANGNEGLVYTITGTTLAPAYIGAYRFDKVEETPIVLNANENSKGLADLLKVFSKNLFAPTADASTCADAPNCYNSKRAPDPYSADSQTLTSGNGTIIDFTILWDPIANIGLSQNTWSPSATGGGSSVNQQITVSNTGAPGSRLTWSASPSTSSGGAWLSVAPSSDSSGLTNGATGNASESVTVTADPSGLAAGTYNGTINFQGTSAPGQTSNPAVTLAVTLTLTGSNPPGGGAGYDCVSNACSAVSSGATYSSLSSCNASCGNGGGNNPPPGGAGYDCVSNACSAVSSGATYGSLSSCNASCGSGTQPPQQPTCPQGDAACQAVCSPSLTATPSSIVVPESSNLQYSCSNVTECQLTGGSLTGSAPVYAPQGSNAISDSVTTAPSITTTYTLTCVNGNYSNDAATSNAKVTVSGSTFCEQNPNGVGCPQ